MPLQPGDIEIYPPKETVVRDRSGKPVAAYEIKIRVRGEATTTIYIDKERYTPEGAEQEILRVAEELVYLPGKYPVKY